MRAWVAGQQVRYRARWAGELVAAGDESDPCATGAVGVAAGEVEGPAGACARSGLVAANMTTGKINETNGLWVMTSFSVKRRLTALYYKHAATGARATVAP